MVALQVCSKSSVKAVFLLIVFFGFGLTAGAKIYLISIPVTGSYTMGLEKPFTINLGEPLYQINEVRFLCSGTVKAGLNYYMQPYSDHFSAYFSTSPGYVIAVGPSVGAGTYPNAEPFSANVAFSAHAGATWNILLDGQAAGIVYLSNIAFIPEFPPWTKPTGTLSTAQIQIDAIPLLTGDFNRTGKVDLADFAIVAQAWASQSQDPNFNSSCDISIPPDGIIDLSDLIELAANWLAE